MCGAQHLQVFFLLGRGHGMSWLGSLAFDLMDFHLEDLMPSMSAFSAVGLHSKVTTLHQQSGERKACRCNWVNVSMAFNNDCILLAWKDDNVYVFLTNNTSQCCDFCICWFILAPNSLQSQMNLQLRLIKDCTMREARRWECRSAPLEF